LLEEKDRIETFLRILNEFSDLTDVSVMRMKAGYNSDLMKLNNWLRDLEVQDK
jgi:hypothetical protein